MELEMDRRLTVKVDAILARVPSRQGDIRIKRVDVFRSRTLTRNPHRDRFDHDPRFSQVLGLNRTEVKHIAEAGDDRVASALADECAAGRALLKAQQS